MNARLITVAIYTYQKAQTIKSLLEREGIDVFIQNVNLSEPTVSSGVRLRIYEKDLPHALSILEREDKNAQEQCAVSDKQEREYILVPIDYSSHSQRACKTAFEFAHSLGAEVRLLHVYYIVNELGAVALTDEDANNEKRVNTESNVLEAKRAEMVAFVAKVERMIESGEYASATFSHCLRYGNPEDEIRKVSSKLNPLMIIMGTRGSNQKEQDLIGSVTADVIDSTAYPLFAISEESSFVAGGDENRVAFFTQFDQNDLLALDTMMRVFGKHPFQVDFVHVRSGENLLLEGLKGYFESHYPNRKASYTVIDGENFIEAVDEYVAKNSISALVLHTRNRGFFAQLFNPSIASKMAFHSNTPLLVIPNK